MQSAPQCRFLTSVGGGQRSGIFQGVARNTAAMERHQSASNSGELARDRIADVIVQISRQPKCRAPRQCDGELRLMVFWKVRSESKASLRVMIRHLESVLESQVRIKSV